MTTQPGSTDVIYSSRCAARISALHSLRIAMRCLASTSQMGCPCRAARKSAYAPFSDVDNVS
jgi:hypothetical protein